MDYTFKYRTCATARHHGSTWERHK